MLPLYLHFSFGRGDPAYVLAQIAFALFVAFLMVSRIPHFSGKRVPRVPREYLAAVLLSVVVLILLVATYPMPMLVILTALYLALIPLAVSRHRAWRRSDRSRDRGSAGPLQGAP